MADLNLDTLESKGLIRLAAIDPELEYLFRHALVQDAAYESLLKQERRALHRQVGEALERLYPERHGELAAVLARHFEQAEEKDKAIDYLVEAARYASDRYAPTEAYELFGRAEALLPAPSDDDPPDLRRRRLEISFGRIRNAFSFAAEEDQLAALGPMVDQAEQLGDLRLIADIRLHDALLRMYNGERPTSSPYLTATLERVSEIGRQLNDPVIGALPRSVVGLFQVFTGELVDGVATLEETAPLLEQKHDFVGSSFALMALGMGLARLGRFDEADRVSERSIEVAKEGDIIARIDAMIGKSAIDAIRGDYEAAVPLAMECTQLAEESGATACVVSSAYLAGEALLQQQRFADAQIAFERSMTISDLTNERMFRPVVNASLHSVAASLGQPLLRGRSIDEALSDARAAHDRWAVTNVIWKRAETEFKKPDSDREQMLADYATTVDEFHDMSARPFEARALRDLGIALRSIGRAEEGNEKLRAAATMLEELGVQREADAIQETLASG